MNGDLSIRQCNLGGTTLGVQLVDENGNASKVLTIDRSLLDYVGGFSLVAQMLAEQVTLEMNMRKEIH